MATSLGVWTLLIILYQTIICLIISWLTLGCRLAPESNEFHEVTLMKLLYLYDPEACGRIYFYNFTLKPESTLTYTNIVWPVKNSVASSFNGKMQIWLALHIIWLFLSIINVTQSQRSCGFYMTLLPFTLSGIAILVTDIVFTAMFLEDANHTKTEVAILKYINSEEKYMRWISEMIPLDDVRSDVMAAQQDTSWIALMFAYGSCRGLVQWIVNFWLIKDNYFEGLTLYHRHQKEVKRNAKKNNS